ncbi:hypothetical protein V4F39_08205 [Aquincola sp. MAHUQ-54]|uniref:L,D-transpeptidase n=1 Tax=Aquincola agrisoli TaxID=3119538 RepID=A0AAW9Q1F8_9BURK
MSHPSDDIADGLKRGLLGALAVCTLVLPPMGQATRAPAPHDSGGAAVVAVPAAEPLRGPRFADFGEHLPSPDARHVADWVVDADDHRGQPFLIVDKRDARVYVFRPDGQLDGATPVLLGYAAGDDSVAGIGSRPIEQVRPEERTTPAGRFVGERGRNTLGEDVVWVDYEAAVSMHRVRATNPAERRLERLATPTADDNRISYGCINVPVAFFESTIAPIFQRTRGIVYVLPETRPAQAVFPSYDVAERHAALAATRLADLGASGADAAPHR